jgi:hypothetical protein
MKKKFNLNFSFKGDRDYVQGPDIFDETLKILLNEFKNIEKIKYTAYLMLHTNATLTITDKFIKKDYKTINSFIVFYSDNIKYHAIISANNNKIETSSHYTEEIVQKDSIIKENIIIFENSLPDSFTEITVSMNKHFLNTTNDASGKWIVTKFDYNNLKDISDIEGKTLKIELLKNTNNTLTKSLLYINNIAIGHLYFSLISKES